MNISEEYKNDVLFRLKSGEFTAAWRPSTTDLLDAYFKLQLEVFEWYAQYLSDSHVSLVIDTSPFNEDRQLTYLIRYEAIIDRLKLICIDHNESAVLLSMGVKKLSSEAIKTQLPTEEDDTTIRKQ